MEKIKGILLTLLGGICWGISGTTAQFLFDNLHVDTQWLTPVRLFYSGVILLIYCFWHYKTAILTPLKPGKDLVVLLIYGIGGVAFSQYLYFLCIALSTAGVGAVLMNVAPIPVLIGSCLVAKRWPYLYEILAIVIGIAGVFLIVTHGNFSDFAVSPAALLAGVGSAMCVAIYNLLGGHLTNKYPVSLVQCWSFLLGGILMFGIFQAWEISYHLNWSLFLGLLVVILIGNIAAFNAFMSGLAIIGPAKGVLYGFSEAVAASIIGWLFLGTHFTGWDFLGFALVFLMLVIISLPNLVYTKKIGR